MRNLQIDMTWDISRNINDFLRFLEDGEVCIDASTTAFSDHNFYALLYHYLKEKSIDSDQLSYITSDYNAFVTNVETWKAYKDFIPSPIKVSHKDAHQISTEHDTVLPERVNYNLAMSDGVYEHHKSLFMMMLLKSKQMTGVNTMFPILDSKIQLFNIWKYFDTEATAYKQFCRDNYSITCDTMSLPLRKNSFIDLNPCDINAYKMRPVMHINKNVYESIYNKKPFIIIGAPGTLDLLRTLRFKTFGDILDESYDTIENNMERLEFIVDMMKKMKPEDIYNKTRRTCEFNKRHLRKLQNEKITSIR